MSHTTTINLEIKSLTALKQACMETKVPYQEHADVTLFDGAIIKDCFSFTPKEWRYPVAAKDGALHFDNYKGAWGDIAELNKVKQRYGVNVQKEAARARGYRVSERTLADGRPVLTVER
jgi:hypothetical protein